ncbi:hypothetical protein BDV96DRAFT_589062 [Lophiotrema nucula]|uniref:HMG box domain-containing protein n=1 Tax=Lophiotrema nucula TaxID=690887 RepID=A0A6A5YN51_9PLEO|nr:hypothetical protein BDV96DRAFT_589062 [Lophiotrema nucula]
MTKQKKEDTGELMVSIEQFTRTRDSVIMSLTNLQSGLSHVQNGLQEVLRAYITHTTSILTGGTGDLDANLQLPSHITAATNAAAENVAQVQASLNSVVPAASSAADAGKKKRKREKKERDPNAPKRPLTAAFLYAQAARPIVKQDLEGSLGPNEKLEPNAVNLEVNKRWNEMPEQDKEKWKASYRDSMEQFKKDLAIYQASVGTDAVLHDDEEASDEAEAGALDSDASSEDEDAIVPTPLAKAQSPPVGKTPKAKRQKTSQANGASTLAAIAPANSTPVPLPTPAGSRTAVPAPGTASEAPAAAAKNSKKKDKKAPQPIAPAPATPAQKEPSPDDTKKKTKSRSTRNTEAEGETPAQEPPKTTKKRDRSKRKSEGAGA